VRSLVHFIPFVWSWRLVLVEYYCYESADCRNYPKPYTAREIVNRKKSPTCRRTSISRMNSAVRNKSRKQSIRTPEPKLGINKPATSLKLQIGNEESRQKRIPDRKGKRQNLLLIRPGNKTQKLASIGRGGAHEVRTEKDIPPPTHHVIPASRAVVRTELFVLPAASANRSSRRSSIRPWPASHTICTSFMTPL
jgi:hypothetical protein